ncbi:MAG: DNA polymerase III subunit tau [Alphaproteobacteria bacterium ADurb.Bin438]|nr:MAG: DNA polymerase III subunit tau [Alphaproteobacteria bacterium ADurb.Bin438]
MLNQLISLYENKSVYGSWLFCGKKGVGKFKTAYDFACHVISCEYENHSKSFIENHPAITVLTRDLHKDEKKALDKKFNKGDTITKDDLKDLKKENSITIEQVRNLIENFNISPVKQGGSRIVIIDSIDDMNNNSANCLLKFLEEPPENTVIILICHSLFKILPTIKSRCRKIQFKVLSDEEISSIILKNYPYISKEDLKVVLNYCDGSVGLGLEFLQNNGLDVYASIRHVIENFPNIDYDIANKVVNNIVKDEIKSDIFKNFILLTLNNRAKMNYDENITIYYEKALKMFEETKIPFNMDLRQTFISILTGNI